MSMIRGLEGGGGGAGGGDQSVDQRVSNISGGGRMMQNGGATMETMMMQEFGTAMGSTQEQQQEAGGGGRGNMMDARMVQGFDLGRVVQQQLQQQTGVGQGSSPGSGGGGGPRGGAAVGALSSNTATTTTTTPSRYEAQKRRDWNTFGQYLKNQRPPLAMSRCSSAHVLEFLHYLDQFGKTKVHTGGCPYFGRPHPTPPACPCPLRQAWGSLDALIGRLRAAFEENGGKPESNPFGTRAVRLYLREVRELQAKARGIAYAKKKRKRPGPAQPPGASDSEPPARPPHPPPPPTAPGIGPAGSSCHIPSSPTRASAQLSPSLPAACSSTAATAAAASSALNHLPAPDLHQLPSHTHLHLSQYTM